MSDLTNKIAVVTGGNSGIGFATAEHLINQGAKVIITGRNPDAVAAAAEKLGNNADGIVADQSLLADTDAFVKCEIFEQNAAGKYQIEFVLDDRDQVVHMWRDELKLPCFQVYYGDF